MTFCFFLPVTGIFGDLWQLCGVLLDVLAGAVISQLLIRLCYLNEEIGVQLKVRYNGNKKKVLHRLFDTWKIFAVSVLYLLFRVVRTILQYTTPQIVCCLMFFLRSCRAGLLNIGFSFACFL